MQLKLNCQLNLTCKMFISSTLKAVYYSEYEAIEILFVNVLSQKEHHE